MARWFARRIPGMLFGVFLITALMGCSPGLPVSLPTLMPTGLPPMAEEGAVAAYVNGAPILMQDVLFRLENVKSNALRQLAYPESYAQLTQEQAKQAILDLQPHTPQEVVDGAIRDEVLKQKASECGIIVTEEEILEEIRRDQAMMEEIKAKGSPEERRGHELVERILQDYIEEMGLTREEYNERIDIPIRRMLLTRTRLLEQEVPEVTAAKAQERIEQWVSEAKIEIHIDVPADYGEAYEQILAQAKEDALANWHAYAATPPLATCPMVTPPLIHTPEPRVSAYPVEPTAGNAQP